MDSGRICDRLWICYDIARNSPNDWESGAVYSGTHRSPAPLPLAGLEAGAGAAAEDEVCDLLSGDASVRCAKATRALPARFTAAVTGAATPALHSSTRSKTARPAGEMLLSVVAAGAVNTPLEFSFARNANPPSVKNA